jgi:hypothetical protein
VADVERDEEALQRSLGASPDAVDELVDAPVLPPGQLQDLVTTTREAEDVGQVVEPAELPELADGLLTEPLDVERAARGEVDERLRDPARAVDVLAEVVALALGPDERLPASPKYAASMSPVAPRPVIADSMRSRA